MPAPPGATRTAGAHLIEQGGSEESVTPAPRNRRDKGPTPLPQIRGKRIDDVLYLHAQDVADALAQLSPTTNKRLTA